MPVVTWRQRRRSPIAGQAGQIHFADDGKGLFDGVVHSQHVFSLLRLQLRFFHQRILKIKGNNT